MKIVTTVAQVQRTIQKWRKAGQRIAFVPTMGNLHQGHLELVANAQQHADRVVVSIFVNPTQFCPGEDFASYPRTAREDQKKLSKAKVDVLFMPDVEEMYPAGANTVVSVPSLSGIYCGASRPGHFDGVATVVCKLFNMVQPDIAVFGLKDFQQITVIQAMVRDLNIPVEILAVDTVREVNGLAMSSRNGYLTSSQKSVAANIYRSLRMARAAVLMGGGYDEIEQQALAYLQAAGLEPEYFAICRSHDLAKAQPDDVELVILVAAKLANTRLIDNIVVNKGT